MAISLLSFDDKRSMGKKKMQDEKKIIRLNSQELKRERALLIDRLSGSGQLRIKA